MAALFFAFAATAVVGTVTGAVAFKKVTYIHSYIDVHVYQSNCTNDELCLCSITHIRDDDLECIPSSTGDVQKCRERV
jgi:hypothetical protein